MVAVPATEMQKNFGLWHDKSYEGPVEITKYGRTTAFLVSAPLFEAMWASYRRALSAGALAESDIDLILRAEVETDKPYRLEDIPEQDDGSSFASPDR